MANQVSQIFITILILSVFYVQFGKKTKFNIEWKSFWVILGSALICWTCDPCPEPFTNTSTTTSIRAANCSSSNTICVVRFFFEISSYNSKKQTFVLFVRRKIPFVSSTDHLKSRKDAYLAALKVARTHLESVLSSIVVIQIIVIHRHEIKSHCPFTHFSFPLSALFSTISINNGAWTIYCNLTRKPNKHSIYFVSVLYAPVMNIEIKI